MPVRRTGYQKALVDAFSVHYKVRTLSGVPDAGDDAEGDFGSGSGHASGRPRPPVGGGEGPGGMGGGPSGTPPDMGSGHRSGGGSTGGVVVSIRVDKPLRLAAAKAGCDTVVAVWTRSPGTGLPSLRAAVVDVATGKWELVSPLSAMPPEATRPGSHRDERQGPPPPVSVEQYAALVEQIAHGSRE